MKAKIIVGRATDGPPSQFAAQCVRTMLFSLKDLVAGCASNDRCQVRSSGVSDVSIWLLRVAVPVAVVEDVAPSASMDTDCAALTALLSHGGGCFDAVPAVSALVGKTSRLVGDGLAAGILVDAPIPSPLSFGGDYFDVNTRHPIVPAATTERDGDQTWPADSPPLLDPAAPSVARATEASGHTVFGSDRAVGAILQSAFDGAQRISMADLVQLFAAHEVLEDAVANFMLTEAFRGRYRIQGGFLGRTSPPS
eukprot:TRINITY_DN20673_c2_g1_i1.p1 TRINITY_DN20673_c2_g1~~TRINITY_DN20673_c2_g1_i1.p1  ORF type:complete len:252 (+),score=39.56 TRINITY_DN20673_c2_g1_i1:220-975(+)